MRRAGLQGHVRLYDDTQAMGQQLCANRQCYISTVPCTVSIAVDLIVVVGSRPPYNIQQHVTRQHSAQKST